MNSNKTQLCSWKFHLGEVLNATNQSGDYMGFDDSQWETVTVPHDWSVTQPFSQEYSSGTGYLCGGIAWYRCEIDLPEDIEGKEVWIHFDGVYNNSQVWCNSHNLGKRPSGYASFSYQLTPFVKTGRNVISVKVSHVHLADSRWFTGSGIYRPVTLELCSPYGFSRHGVFAYTKALHEEMATVAVQWQGKKEGCTVDFALEDQEGNTIATTGKSTNAKLELTVQQAKLWSPDTPTLYKLLGRIYHKGELVEEMALNFGFRDIRFDPKEGFFLNGVNTKFRGVCLHHDGGVLGAAVAPEVWRRRLEKLKAVGCNAIRCSHNPPAADFLDLCDEMGFLVMDEAFDEWEGIKNKWWQGHNVYPPKLYGYGEDFPQWHKADLQEMVLRDRNHPSIVLWSIGNEIDYPNDPYCSPLFGTTTGNNDKNKPAKEREYDPQRPDMKRLATVAKNLVALVKEVDTTRPVTAAIAFPELSNPIGYCDALDVVGYNYKEHLYEEDHGTYPNRVLYGSENGHKPQQWQAVAENDYISGQFLWTGIDYLGEAQGWPRRVATPGLLTLAGMEKPKYYHRKALWQENTQAELCCKLATVYGDNPQEERFSWNYAMGEEITVFCYSNGNSGELFLNGQSQGKQSNPKDCVLQWTLPFAVGTLEVVVEGEGQTVKDILHTTGETNSVHCTVRKGKLWQVELSLLDAEGRAICHQEEDIQWTVTEGEFLGAESGDPEDLVPYSSDTRRTFHGKQIGYVRCNSANTEVTITCKARNITKTVT